jgi:hypothetical protein
MTTWINSLRYWFLQCWWSNLYTSLWVYRQHWHLFDIQTNGTTPLDITSSHSHVVSRVCCLRRIYTLKGALLGKVHQAFYEKIMKPDTSQDSKQTWIQMAQGPKHEAVKLRGLKQKMLKLRWQVSLSKSQRKRRQGPTCRSAKIQENTRSIGERVGAKTGLGWPAHPIPSPIRRPLWPRPSSVHLKLLPRRAVTSIYQRCQIDGDMSKEANNHHKSSSCIGDGLGHALTAMVGPAWWSHRWNSGAMPWIYQGNCTFNIPWWYKSYLFLTLIYFDACFIPPYV